MATNNDPQFQGNQEQVSVHTVQPRHQYPTPTPQKKSLRKLHIKLTRTKNHDHHAKLPRHGLLKTHFKHLSTFKTTEIQLQPAAANSTEPHVNNTEAKSTAANKILISDVATFRALRNSHLNLTTICTTDHATYLGKCYNENLIPVDTPRILDEQVLAGI
jgi:hypothetical protein